MKKFSSTSIFFIMLFFSLLIYNTCFALTVNSNHPRIFISSEEISTLQARSGVSNSGHSEYRSHQSEYENVKETADRYTEAQIRSVDGLNKARMTLANAFVYMMEGGSDYFNKARVILDAIPNLGSDDKSYYGFYVGCIIFDWLYNDLSASQKVTYANSIANFVKNSSWYGQYNSFDPYYNKKKYITSIFALSGQAIYNENPEDATEFIRRSILVFNRMISIQNEIAEDGFIYPIGQAGYFDESSWQAVLRVLGGLKLAGLSGPEIDSLNYSSISKTAYGEIYSLVKDNYLVPHNDGISASDKPWRYTRGPEGPFYSAILAKLHQGEEIGRITNYLQSNYIKTNISEKPFHYLGSILFNNKSANSIGTTITSLPKTKMFDDTVLVYRTGWDGLKSNNNEIIFNFTADKHVNGHTQYSKGHFDIWRGYDPLTFSSGNYGATAATHYLYYGDSLAHNVMLIRNPSEDTGPRPNDGGQLTNTGEGNLIGMQDSSAWRTIGHTNPNSVTYTGEIKRSAVSDAYFYSYLHYPSSYSTSKVSDMSRSFVRMGDYFIVLDRVKGINASFKKKWLLHSIGEPTIMDSGEWNGQLISGGTPNQTSNDAKLLKVMEGNSSLFVKSIFPDNTIVHRVGGSDDYRFYSYNENTNYTGAGPTDGRYGNWRIEIESNENSVDDVFLNVLYPTSRSGSMVSTVGLSGSNYRGVQIDDSVAKVVLFSNSVDESTKENSYQFSINSSSDLNVIVCDLEQGIYEVFKDGELLRTVNCTGNSIVSFDTTGGGSFLISKQGEPGSAEGQPSNAPLNVEIVPSNEI